MQLFISSISVKQCTTIRLQGQCSLLPRELHRLLSRHQGLRNWTTCQCLHARDQGRSDRHQILQVWYCNQCALLNSIIECNTYHSLMCKYIKYTCSQQPHNMGLTKHNVGCGTYSSGSKSVNWLRKQKIVLLNFQNQQNSISFVQCLGVQRCSGAWPML